MNSALFLSTRIIGLFSVQNLFLNTIFLARAIACLDSNAFYEVSCCGQKTLQGISQAHQTIESILSHYV